MGRGGDRRRAPIATEAPYRFLLKTPPQVVRLRKDIDRALGTLDPVHDLRLRRVFEDLFERNVLLPPERRLRADPLALDINTPIPALALGSDAPAARLIQTHGVLFRRCAVRVTTLPTDPDPARPHVPVEVWNLIDSWNARALCASISMLIQANKIGDGTLRSFLAELKTTVRDGLFAEGLTDAYFGSREVKPLAGAFFRPGARLGVGRMTQGNGLDHFYRVSSVDSIRYIVADAKFSEADLRKDETIDILKALTDDRTGQIQLSDEWLRRNIGRVSGLPVADRDRVLAADGCEVERVAVTVRVASFKAAELEHVPDPYALVEAGVPVDRVVIIRMLPELRALATPIGIGRHDDFCDRQIAARAAEEADRG